MINPEFPLQLNYVRKNAFWGAFIHFQIGWDISFIAPIENWWLWWCHFMIFISSRIQFWRFQFKFSWCRGYDMGQKWMNWMSLMDVFPNSTCRKGLDSLFIDCKDEIKVADCLFVVKRLFLSALVFKNNCCILPNWHS